MTMKIIFNVLRWIWLIHWVNMLIPKYLNISNSFTNITFTTWANTGLMQRFIFNFKQGFISCLDEGSSNSDEGILQTIGYFYKDYFLLNFKKSRWYDEFIVFIYLRCSKFMYSAINKTHITAYWFKLIFINVTSVLPY